MSRIASATSPAPHSRPIACAMRCRRRSWTTRRTRVEAAPPPAGTSRSACRGAASGRRRRGCGYSPWTQPRPFWNAIAPCMHALIMCSAPRGRCRRGSRARCAPRRARRPSRAMPSAGGFTAGAMKVSMQCAIASMPVAAVRSGGRPSVSSGSQIGGLGHQVPAVEAELAAVVDDDDGAARHLAAGAGGGRHRDQRRNLVGDLARCRPRWWRSLERALVRGGDRDALGESIAEPPPTAIRPSQPSARNTSTAARTAARSGSTASRRTPLALPPSARAPSSRPAARTPASVTTSGLAMPARSHSCCRRAGRRSRAGPG